ncbi:hypothetical protein LPJ59_006147 [Coemansia sp. RSA 2399]|nr:hypothetical protein LPJ59_006147 [Coemansia sp. RSA 2399]KAJ1889709.1 hypothetical protein LPJ81_006077 [Coemansia sp. IMI 209127]
MYKRLSLFITPIWRLQKPAETTAKIFARSRLLTSKATDAGDDDTKKKHNVQPVILNDEDIEEKHVRGWGNGGQKMNKTSSCVQLLHKPTNTIVICQETRYLQQNRKIARKRLVEKLDLLLNGQESKIGKKIRKIQARKHKTRQRSKKKYTPEKDDGACDLDKD